MVDRRRGSWHTRPVVPVASNGLAAIFAASSPTAAPAPAGLNRSGYRPDIDGLRAVAVLPVVLFHFGFASFGGGFVGVDIFFVISGYLITGILAAELAAGTYSIRGFYERRIRRIIPALAFVVAVTAAVAALLLTPREMGRFSSEVWWSSLFSSNVLFFRKDGYFDGASTMRLLLHTWSLSVEEQYYIVVPVLLWAGWRWFRRHLVALLLVLGLASLALAVYSVAFHPSAAFYLLPSRAWELLCGSLLALAPSRAKVPSRLREAVAWAGLAAIAVAIFAYDGATPFPGAAALLPCLGATALLWAGEQGASTTIGRLLCLPPMLAVGRISYSLYLWHWPVLVLAKYYLLREPDLAESVALIALAVAMSAFSYRFVEQPFRRRVLLGGRRALFAGGGVVLVAMFAFGLAGKSGFPGRFDHTARQLAAYAESRDPRHDACMDLSADKIRRGELCSYGQPRDGAPDFMVWGDSHAGALMPAFSAVAQRRGLWGLHSAFPSCPPLLGVSVVRSDSREAMACAQINEAALEQIAARHIRTVVLAARWPLYAEGWARIGADARNKPLTLTDAEAPTPDAAGRKAVFQRGLDRLLTRLRQMGVRVLVVEPVPETLVDVPNALATSRLLGRDTTTLGPEVEQVAARQAWVRERFAQEQQAGRLSVIPTHASLCGADRCQIQRDGVPLYHDVDHLSVPGALVLDPALDAALTAALRP
ncbi:MAG TPA: acyltransferase family protein [Magnetospirillum sp.]|nr:acyltransferase family protein [Magnetospirillum sp.]